MKPTIVIFVAYLDEASYFEDLRAEYNCIFNELSSTETPQEQVERIYRELKESSITIDGIFGINEEEKFLTALLAEKLGLPHLSLRTLYTAQNKAKFAEVAKKVNQYYPETVVLASVEEIPPVFSYPAWLKPAVGSLSMFAYKIDSKEHLQQMLPELLEKKRENPVRLVELYKPYMQDTALLHAFLLQPYINAKQYTVDGLVFQGNMSLLGMTESVYTADRKSFDRFDYPVRIHEDAFAELKGILQKLINELEYDNAGFNVEFFVKENKIIIIELNSRLSQQFYPLFEQNFQQSPLQMTLEIAQGKPPNLKKKGRQRCTSSCILRVPHDGIVRAVPSDDEAERLVQQGSMLKLTYIADPGEKLSDYDQDSYTFRYAWIDIAGDTRQEILGKLDYCKKHLTFTIEKSLKV